MKKKGKKSHLPAVEKHCVDFVLAAILLRTSMAAR